VELDAGRQLRADRQTGRLYALQPGNSFPFFDNLRDGITLTPQVDTIEGGVKLSTKPFSLYATLFHNRFQGLVTTVITEGAPMASVGGASATGVELEGQWHPLPALSVAFSGSWLDAHYRHFFTNDGLTDLSGNRVQRQPQWQGRITQAGTAGWAAARPASSPRSAIWATAGPMCRTSSCCRISSRSMPGPASISRRACVCGWAKTSPTPSA
jgi:hypothetical protein